MARKKRLISAEDLYRLEGVSDPQISPDGKQVMFVVQRVDAATEKKFTNLWLVATGNGRSRQFTYGDQADHSPRWSPDGKQIAFLSNRGNLKQFQLYLIPINGGEARPLTKMSGSFGGYSWSPDGKQLLCGFVEKDAETKAREADEQKQKLGVVARHITRPTYKMNGAGFLPDSRRHIWLIDAKNGKAKALTEGMEFNEVGATWSPDGTQIAYFSNRTKTAEFDLFDVHAVDLYVMNVLSGESRKVETPVSSKNTPAFSPDGQWIAYYARKGLGDWWQNNNLWVVPADGSGEARDLTAVYDIQISNDSMNDVGSGGQMPPTWASDSQRIFFQASQHGDTRFCSVAVDGTDWQTHLGDGVVGAFTLDAAQEKVAYTFTTLDEPLQLWVQEMANGRLRKRTSFNSAWLRQTELGETEEVWFKGPDGNDLQGWILKPPNFDPSKKYPSILEIHGGPWGQYGRLFFHEFQYFAANEYVVYYTNPRGGQGYGEAHGKSIHRRWGTDDYADLMAWADYVEKQPYVDPARMGVTGGSYGGYMTLWTVGHTDRFKAAVSQRPVSNTISFWGSSDIGFMFDPWSNKPMYEDIETYWKQSPMKHIKNVTTPTMIVHSEQDLRCVMEQGEQAFIALKQLGVDTELILFPNEHHGLSRVGRTDRRIARLNHMLRWFDKYLK